MDNKQTEETLFIKVLTLPKISKASLSYMKGDFKLYSITVVMNRELQMHSHIFMHILVYTKANELFGYL